MIELSVEGLPLYERSAKYTMIRHQGLGAKSAAVTAISANDLPMAYATSQFSAVCVACHSLEGFHLVGPSLRGNDKPLAEALEDHHLAMPDLNFPESEARALINWLKIVK